METLKDRVYSLLLNTDGWLKYQEINELLGAVSTREIITATVNTLAGKPGITVHKKKSGLFNVIIMTVNKDALELVPTQVLYEHLITSNDHKTMNQMLTIFDKSANMTVKKISSIMLHLRRRGVKFSTVKDGMRTAYKLTNKINPPKPRGVSKAKHNAKHDNSPKVSTVTLLFSGNAERAVKQNKNMIKHMA